MQAKADPKKSAGIAKAVAVNAAVALTTALVNAGKLDSQAAAEDTFWKLYADIEGELRDDEAAKPAAKPAPKKADNVTPINKAEENLEAGGPTDAPGDFVVTFGKHKGKTIAAIHAEDAEYVTGNDGWPGLVKSRNEDAAAAAQAFVATLS